MQPKIATVFASLIGAALVGLALSGCDHDLVFDASSPAAYQKSLDEITAKLSADDQRRLQIALVTIAVGNTAQSNAVVLAVPGSLANLVSLQGVANPLPFLDRVRATIDGRSAAAVIRKVAADLDSEISREEAQSAGADKVLAAVAIEHPRYRWDSQHKQPTIDFSVFNGTKNVIYRIYVSGVLTVAEDRAGKWLTGGLNYDFQKGLEPGEQMPVTLIPKVASAQTIKSLASLYNADVSVKVTNIETSAGKKLVPIDVDILDGMREKRKLLRGS